MPRPSWNPLSHRGATILRYPRNVASSFWFPLKRAEPIFGPRQTNLKLTMGNFSHLAATYQICLVAFPPMVIPCSSYHLINPKLSHNQNPEKKMLTQNHVKETQRRISAAVAGWDFFPTIIYPGFLMAQVGTPLSPKGLVGPFGQARGRGVTSIPTSRPTGENSMVLFLFI